jgi:putative membrane protein
MRHLLRPMTFLAALGVVPLTAGAQERPWDAWGMHPMWTGWGRWGVGMMLVMVGFWALAIAGVVLGLRWLLGQGGESRPDRALATLRERYARGEIDREEFEARRRDLDAA